MEALEIVWRNPLVLHHCGIRQSIGACGNIGFGHHVLMPMTDALDDPGGLDIDKDRAVIRRELVRASTPTMGISSG